MASASPTVNILARGAGPPSADELEARTPLGRAVHRVEGQRFGISMHCISRRETRPTWAQSDDILDAGNRDNEALSALMLGHPDPVVQSWGVRLAGNCATYRLHDPVEDAVTLEHYDAFAAIHDLNRAISGFLERLAVAVRRRR